MNDANETAQRQPIGLLPETVWRMKRVQELASAIDRYVSSECWEPVVLRWVEELHRHSEIVFIHDSK